MKNIVRWGARILSLPLVGIVGLIFIGESLAEGFPNPVDLTASENIGLIVFFLMVVGLVAAWKWELGGAILTILGYLVFCAIEGKVMLGLFALFPGIAILFIWSWFLSRADEGR